MVNEIKKAIEILKKGGIIIFPTDTAFGIGCRIDDEEAVEKLFKIRKRPSSMATPVLVDSFEMVKVYLKPVSEDARNLMDKYWPGALTIVLPCKTDKVSGLVRGEGKTIGIRVPDNKIIREIIKGVGVPILGPSANFHGEKTPYKLSDLDPNLVDLVDFVISGKTSVGNISTVIDCSVSPWKILRQGAVKIQQTTVLYIDSTSNEKVVIELKVDQKKYKEEKKVYRDRSQVLLPMIENILKKHKLEPKDLSSIEVNAGPGSFTGIRIGISIANALSFSLNIPVNGKKLGEFAEPLYE